MKCLYCEKEIKKGYKIGPNMTYCNEECSYLDALKKYPDTSFANMIKRIRPYLAEKRNCTNCNREMTEGYVIDGGEEYYCSDKCLHEEFTEKEYKELYEQEQAYWTEF